MIVLKHLVRPLVYSVIVLAVGAFAISALTGPQGVSALMAKWEQIRQLEQDNNDIRDRINKKRKRIQMLEEQRDAIDMELRRELHQVRKNEKVLILEGPPKAAAPADPPSSPN